MSAKICPHCGAPETGEDRWSRKFACGYTVNFDGPPFPCPNASHAVSHEATARAARLTELGDECTAAEAQTLTDGQYAHRLTVAQQAQREREEHAKTASVALEQIAVAAWAQAALDSLVPPPVVQDVRARNMADNAWRNVRGYLTSLRDGVRG